MKVLSCNREGVGVLARPSLRAVANRLLTVKKSTADCALQRMSSGLDGVCLFNIRGPMPAQYPEV